MLKRLHAMEGDKLLRTNTIAVLAVGVIYSALQIFLGRYLFSSIIIGLCLLLAVFAVAFKKIIPFRLRAQIVSMGQFLIIFGSSIIMSTVHEVFSLYLASLVMASIYFEKKVIIAQAIIANICLIGAFLLFRDSTYSNADTMMVIKGIAGYNIGFVFLLVLVTWGHDLVDDSHAKTAETERLLETIRIKMQESEELAKSQSSILDRVEGCSRDVLASSEAITSISGAIHSGIDAQAGAVEDLSATMQSFTDKIAATAKAAEQASGISENTSEVMQKGEEEMREMLSTVSFAAAESKKISTIIKTIDDIAFQTNLLALNASVEAARAGSYGSGFAVVANEVRSLANRCAKSAKDTGELVEKILDLIGKSAKIADSVTETFEQAVESEKVSSEKLRDILAMTQDEYVFVNELNRSVERISAVIAQNNAVIAESETVTYQLTQHAETLSDIVHE